jgi:hypothetical protein
MNDSSRGDPDNAMQGFDKFEVLLLALELSLLRVAVTLILNAYLAQSNDRQVLRSDNSLIVLLQNPSYRLCT